MTDKRLKVFCTVAETLSFTKAAALLGISQPAVTKNIAVLEQELGCALFVRIGKTLILTETGTRLLAISSNILEQYCQINALKR